MDFPQKQQALQNTRHMPAAGSRCMWKETLSGTFPGCQGGKHTAGSEHRQPQLPARTPRARSLPSLSAACSSLLTDARTNWDRSGSFFSLLEAPMSIEMKEKDWKSWYKITESPLTVRVGSICIQRAGEAPSDYRRIEKIFFFFSSPLSLMTGNKIQSPS